MRRADDGHRESSSNGALQFTPESFEAEKSYFKYYFRYRIHAAFASYLRYFEVNAKQRFRCRPDDFFSLKDFSSSCS